MMKKRSTLTALISTSITGVILLGLFSYGAYITRSYNERTALILGEADNAAGEAILLQSIRSSRSRLSEDLDELNRLVLNESEIVPLIETIERAGRNRGLTVNIASVSVVTENNGRGSKRAAPEPQPGEPKKMRFVIEAEGSREGSLAFLRILESIPYLVLMEEVSLKHKDTNWQSNTTLTTYAF